jgi:hypothetical protein
MFKRVDVGNVGSRWQVLKEGIIPILLVRAEQGELVGRVGFTA